MKSRGRIIMFSFVVLVVVLAFSFLEESNNKAVEKSVIATKLVNECANIKEGEIVLISGGVNNIELLEDISTEVHKLGAFPIVSINTDRMTKKYFEEVPTKYDSKFPHLSLKLASIIDASISVSSNEDQSLLADVSPKRLSVIRESNIVIGKVWFEKGIKTVSLGNNLYPTADRAEMFNMKQEDLVKVFWSGVNSDYKELQKIGSYIKKILNTGNVLEISNTNGTNLKVNIENRPIHISDGIITDEDIIQGGTGCEVWLPAGEVYLTPVLGTAEGKVLIEKDFVQGKEIKNLELIFKAGKLISIKAESGLKKIKEIYDAAGEGKDLLSFIDIGINPNINSMEDNNMVAWMQSGMITIGTGINTWAGGDIESDYSSAFFLKGCNLKVDSKILIENGKLKL